jgi:hypothetical protein
MKDGFAGKPLATYEHRKTVQMYSYSSAPNRPGTHGASFGAVENDEHSKPLLLTNVSHYASAKAPWRVDGVGVNKRIVTFEG